MLASFYNNKSFTFTTDFKCNSKNQRESICVNDFGKGKHVGLNPKHAEIVSHPNETINITTSKKYVKYNVSYKKKR